VSRSNKRVLLIVGAALFSLGLLAAGAGALFLGTVGRAFGPSSVPEEEALALAREWARLAPFPGSATNLRVEVAGSAFTREFIIEFEAPLADIDAWWAASSGTAQVQRTKQSTGVWVFAVDPGGGAQFAEVVLEERGTVGKVRVRTYWS